MIRKSSDKYFTESTQMRTDLPTECCSRYVGGGWKEGRRGVRAPFSREVLLLGWESDEKRERERERERDSERASERDGDGEMKDNYLCAGRSAPSCDKPLEPCLPDGFIRLKKLQSSQVTASRIIAITAEPKNV